MLRISPRLTLFALLPYPALILGGRAFTRAMYRASRDLQEQIGRMSTAVQEDPAGAAVVKQYALEPLRHAAFSRQNESTSTARCAWCERAARWARCSRCLAASAR